MMPRLLGLLLVCYACLNVSAAAFHRKDEGLKERIDEALVGRNQDQTLAAVDLNRVFEREVFNNRGGSVRVLLLGIDARAAAKAFVGPSTTCYDLTNTSRVAKSSDDIKADIKRLTSQCRQPCEAVIVVEHAELLESGQPLNPLLAVINDESVEATVLVLYESDAWRSPEEQQAKASIARRLKADWGMKDQFNTDAFVGRFQVVPFAPTRQGQPGDLGPICAGPGELSGAWESWVEWSTQPRQLLTIAGGVLVVALMHWSISAAMGGKKGGNDNPFLVSGGGQAPPSGGGPSGGRGAAAGGRRRASVSSPSPRSPSQDIETPKARPRGAASRRASTGPAVSPSSSSDGADVRRSSRLQKKKKEG